VLLSPLDELKPEATAGLVRSAKVDELVSDKRYSQLPESKQNSGIDRGRGREREGEIDRNVIRVLRYAKKK
jgi:hypothetical protein